jgi:uncharacterized protein
MLQRYRALTGSLAGHYWTLRPFASDRYGALRAGPGQAGVAAAAAWQAPIDDPRFGASTLTGTLLAPAAARVALLCVHGLGGSAESPYLTRAALAAAARGWACLRLSLRGADGAGGGLYHAGLTDDLHAALASPALAPFSDLFVIGYSLGGHLALRLASEPHDRRLRAVAAVCAPIDLARSQVAIDRPGCWVYRQYVLGRLKQCYAALARRCSLPTPLEVVARVATVRQWDACTVVPCFGFASPEDYYAHASVNTRLDRLEVPALLVNTEHDPMVPAATVRPALPEAAPRLTVRWVRAGGHVGFPVDADLGQPTGRGLERQVLGWLERASTA